MFDTGATNRCSITAEPVDPGARKPGGGMGPPPCLRICVAQSCSESPWSFGHHSIEPGFFTVKPRRDVPASCSALARTKALGKELPSNIGRSSCSVSVLSAFPLYSFLLIMPFPPDSPESQSILSDLIERLRGYSPRSPRISLRAPRSVATIDYRIGSGDVPQQQRLCQLCQIPAHAFQIP